MAEKKKKIKDRIPPQNIEAEQSVLGALMLDKDAIIKVTDILTPEDFYKDIHKIIYEAMIELYEQSSPIDVVSLSNKLGEKEKLEEIGGRSYLASLANSVPTAVHVAHYAKIVQKKSTLRKLIQSASEIAALGYDETKDVDVLLDKAEQSLFQISQRYMKQNFISLKSILTDTFNRIDELHKESGKLRGLSTGFTDIDNLLAGLQKSDLIILASRPSMGKTSLALDIARHIAIKEKTPVGIFSLEMSKEQLADRLLCAEANIDLWKMRTGKLSERVKEEFSEERSDFERIGDALAKLSEAEIYIDDSPSANIMEIRTKARRLQLEHNLGLIIVDYLQLMEGRGMEESRVQEVSEISRSLKAIARELHIPVLAISQLSRAVESRIPQIPQLADLRESGSIEQDADVVMFIYREEFYKPDTDRKNIADIFVKKHRNGPTGQVSLFFDAEKVSFKNLETKREQEIEDMIAT